MADNNIDSISKATEQNNAPSESLNRSQNKLMLTVDSLSITIATGIQLVDALSYELRQGQTLAIVGESGSGKSIASLALLGLLPESLTIRGEVQLASTAYHKVFAPAHHALHHPYRASSEH